MTTGTIIFIVILVLQAVIRFGAKQAEKKASAAKTQAQGAQAVPLKMSRNDQVTAPAIVAMPQRTAWSPPSPATQEPSGAADARSYMEEIKRRLDQFAQEAPAVVAAPAVVPAKPELFDFSFDASMDEDDPAGESTAAYLRERSRQIHDGALRGRHPKATGAPASSAAPGASVAPNPLSRLRSTLATSAGLRQGVVLAEVLGPPISLR